MPHPTGLAYGFAVVMVGVSLYCVAWLIVATRRRLQNHVDVNISHVAMGLGMAGMLVPRLNLLPDGLWEGIFVVIAAWFAYEGVRFVTGKLAARDETASHGLSHYLIHLVMALAMLYMYFAAKPVTVAGGSGMNMTVPTGATANFGGLPLLFIVVVFVSAVWQLDGLSRYAPSDNALLRVGAISDTGAGGARGSWEPAELPRLDVTSPPDAGSAPGPSQAPRLEMGCHIAMCITMGYMLILLL